MITNQLLSIANHVWQSTLFAAVAGLLTLALRKNRAQTRYCLWLLASVKFFIPFSLLVTIGSYFGRHSTTATFAPGLSHAAEQVSQPFSPSTSFATITPPTASSAVNWIPAVLYGIWAIGFAILLLSWWLRWRRLRAALRTAAPLDLPIGIEAMTSAAFAEPGVFRHLARSFAAARRYY
jgi:beta-lactamase regulating signal transducer with metallopeptidase domain